LWSESTELDIICAYCCIMSADRTNPSALLLLPPPPAFSVDKVKEAFAPSLIDVLTKLSEDVHGSSRIAVLDVALVIPLTPDCKPRAKVFAQLQQYLTSVYSLVGALCATHNIELDTPGGIDVRLVFIDHASGIPLTEASDSSLFGPVLGLQSLANSGRRWDHVFYLSNTIGEDLAKSFIDAQTQDDRTASMQAITCSPDWTIPQPLLIPDDQPSTSNPHSSVIVGGTFDHLHLGHKLLLTAVALALEPLDQEGRLIFGVTGDALLVNKKHAEFLEDWEQRWQNTASFLLAIMDFSPDKKSPEIERTFSPKAVLVKIHPKLTFDFVEISEPFGPTITRENIDAIVVSRETRSGGAAVNDERMKKGWKPLAVFEVDVLQTDGALGNENFESKISSTEVRRRRAHLAKV
jgi:phosphopantetheine adenylyltransferase